MDYVTELHRAVHAVGLYLDARLQGEVSQPEALVVLALSRRSPRTINDLHHAFLHRRSTLTSVLDRLESKGFATRAAAAADRRSVSVTLTARGKRLAETIERALEELRHNVEDRTTIGERDVVRPRTVAEEATALREGGD